MESQRNDKVTHLGNCIDLGQVVLHHFGLGDSSNSIARKIHEDVSQRYELPLLFSGIRGGDNKGIKSIIEYGTNYLRGIKEDGTCSVYAKLVRKEEDFPEAISEAVHFSAKEVRVYPKPKIKIGFSPKMGVWKPFYIWESHCEIARVRRNNLVLVYDATNAILINEGIKELGGFLGDLYRVPTNALLQIYHFNLLLGVVR